MACQPIFLSAPLSGRLCSSRESIEQFVDGKENIQDFSSSQIDYVLPSLFSSLNKYLHKSLIQTQLKEKAIQSDFT